MTGTVQVCSLAGDLRFTVIALAILGVGVLLIQRQAVRPPVNLAASERSAFSPGGEDGILEKIFEIVPPRHRFLVDLGAGDGLNGSSSRNLFAEHGWRGVVMEPDADLGQALLDRYADDDAVVAVRGLVDPGSIEIILERQGVLRDLDLVIIGLEANDWYVWRAIHDFRPSVVLVQYNAAFVPPQTMVIDYHPFNYWDGSIYFGASIQSLANLGKRKGYELLYADSAGSNLFFVEAALFDRFGVRDNSPLTLFRGSEGLPLILPGLIDFFVDGEGHPMEAPELIAPEARIPRTFVLNEF